MSTSSETRSTMKSKLIPASKTTLNMRMVFSPMLMKPLGVILEIFSRTSESTSKLSDSPMFKTLSRRMTLR